MAGLGPRTGPQQLRGCLTRAFPEPPPPSPTGRFSPLCSVEINIHCHHRATPEIKVLIAELPARVTTVGVYSSVGDCSAPGTSRGVTVGRGGGSAPSPSPTGRPGRRLPSQVGAHGQAERMRELSSKRGQFETNKRSRKRACHSQKIIAEKAGTVILM